VPRIDDQFSDIYVWGEDDHAPPKDGTVFWVQFPGPINSLRVRFANGAWEEQQDYSREWVPMNRTPAAWWLAF
jgi:hypothetical protein